MRMSAPWQRHMFSSWGEGFPRPIAYVSEQPRFLVRLCGSAARLILYCLHMVYRLFPMTQLKGD